ncbi:hypothetical protein EVAR_32015_1 [Eumeta japonica]|uniref:Uncharacterized protein n=1 Tax=Eumeta variegata TaxID=151549 RepID=A0A4C1YIE5_EUMVA|nr:hypothetical protein EVAR_32015_1 [Eumeta japonica]
MLALNQLHSTAAATICALFGAITLILGGRTPIVPAGADNKILSNNPDFALRSWTRTEAVRLRAKLAYRAAAPDHKKPLFKDPNHVLVHEFMSIYYALAGWSGNRERRDERTKRKREKEKVRSCSKIPISSKLAVRNFVPKLIISTVIRLCAEFKRTSTKDDLGSGRPTTVMQQNVPPSPNPTKFKANRSAGKIMDSLFWDSKEISDWRLTRPDSGGAHLVLSHRLPNTMSYHHNIHLYGRMKAKAVRGAPSGRARGVDGPQTPVGAPPCAG